MKEIFHELDFDAQPDGGINAWSANNFDMRLVNLGPIVFFSENKLSTVSGDS